MVWTNLLHRTRFFGRAVLLALPIGHVKNEGTEPKCTPDREATTNNAFYSLLCKQGLPFSFLIYFHWKFLQFFSLYVFVFVFTVWISKIRFIYSNIYFLFVVGNLQIQSCLQPYIAYIHKNMLISVTFKSKNTIVCSEIHFSEDTCTI